MPRDPFYPIKKESFLFPEQSLRSGDRNQLEEPVRQWCAYELIRAYGIKINELEFEHSVRVGSKDYRIDILVLRGGLPWLVVECKEPSHAKPAKGIDQAISYATAQSIQAPFALYTNGDLWHVKRRLGNQWLPVPDLPGPSNHRSGEPLTEILRALDAAAPLLYKLDEPLAGNDAIRFLSALQAFFNSGNLLTDGTDQDLRVGTDNLLRVLAGIGNHRNYRLGKLSAARHAFESYRKKAALGAELPSTSDDLSLAGNNQQLHAALMSWIEGSEGIDSLNLLLLRLNVALTHYGMDQPPAENAAKPIPPAVHHALTDFLNAAFAINLNAQLPDNQDHILIRDMKASCQSGWKRAEKQPGLSFRNILSALMERITRRH